MGPTLAQTFSTAASSPAPIHEAGSQDAHKDCHAQEADSTHDSSQHRLGQEAWQLCARRVDLQAWARKPERGSAAVNPHNPQPPIPHWALTRSRDVGCVAGITDVVASKGHKAKLIESILGIRGGEP